jgi:hypothetical protein
MGVAVAKRARKYLDLPTTIITDQITLDSNGAKHFKFDHTVVVEPDRNNYIKKATWINKGRFRVHDLTPYDDTIVLDTDYMINSSRLLEVFKQPTDFCCYRSAKYFFSSEPNEMTGPYSLPTYWATVMRFQKTQRTREIFKMVEMIQNNYPYYAELHGFLPYTYRNDYAITLALHTVNGHIEDPADFIPGELQHINSVITRAERVDATTYNLRHEEMVRGRKKKSIITIKDIDFHMLNKENYMSLIYDETN